MWPFKKKIVPKQKVITWVCPDEHAEDFCRLYDDMEDDKKISLYRFWKFVAKLLATDREKWKKEGWSSYKARVDWSAHDPELEITLKQ